MKTALRTLLTMTMLGGGIVSSGGIALADGPYGEPTYQDPNYGQDPNANGQDPNAYGQPAQPGYPSGDPNGQDYQPPPEGTCIDDNNQTYDCSSDTDYSSYSQIDDGYDPNAYQDFQSTLAPYGQWVSTEQYGQVWIPSTDIVGADFTPYYSGGRWNMTDYGWTWVSDYNWGWAPFHYGRWHRVGNYGWGWIPGRIWGPAWVHWRLGGGYVGWAALPPRGVRIAPVYAGRSHFWNFVPMAQITAPRLVRVAPAMTVGLWGRTAIASDLRAIGSTRIVYGPPVHHFAGASIRIQPAPLASFQMAMPRASIVVRAGVPMASRPYYAPAYRANWGGGGRTFSTPPGRPGYPGGGYQPTPAPRPGYPGGGYQPAPRPGYPGGGYQPTPAPRPGYPGGGYQPAPAPRPGYPGGGYQPAPAPHPGGGYQPAPAPRPAYPGGGFQPAPAPAPHPGGGYQPAPAPRPAYPGGGFQPAPAPRPAYPGGGFQPAPAPAPRPAFQPPVHTPPPSFQPPPSRPSTPSFQPPVHHTPPPSFQPPPSRPSAPSFQPPPSRPSAPSYSPPSRPSAPSFSPPPSRPSAPSFSPPPSRPSAPSFSPPPHRR